MKAVCIPKSCLDFYISYVDSSINETFYTEWFSLDNDAHRYELILKVDEGNFPSYEVKSIIFDNIKNMPGKLTSDLNGIPVIGFYDDSSVICVCENDEYKFLNVWNGIFGNQLLIAFDEVKPKLFNKAAESHRRKPSFVVSDLINIMSRSPEEQINKWQFKVTRDAKNPILIEFDCYGGIKKAATPAFLMGMLLKEHLKAIKYETGENPTEIGFYFINQTETERIKKQIKESCRLLKIGCIFVNA
uniref:Uncharacterized protein n=1 Tax=Panagrolaimus davidi TaxID=227884 RepID=A0A914Q474_9BILA